MRFKKKTPPLRRLSGEPSARTLRLIRTAAHLSLVSMLALWVVLYFWKEDPYAHVWQVFVAHLAGGRAGGVGAGLRIGFSHRYLFLQSCLTDLILILYVYPLFVSGFQHIARWPLIGPWLTKMHTAALKHKDRIAPYGAAGLILFVIIPIWSTGPIVGVLVGYMLGMRTWVTFSTVILGDFAAIAAWIWFWDKLNGINDNVALAFLALIFVLAIAGVVYTRIVRWKKHAAALKETSDPAEKQEESAPQTDSISEATPDTAVIQEEVSAKGDAATTEAPMEKKDSPPADPEEKDDDFLELL